MTSIAVPGAPCWVDLSTTDRDGAERFYGELFGWQMIDPGAEFGGYRQFQREGVPVAGCMANDGSMGPTAWNIYLAVADAADTVRRATAAGATVIVPPMPVTDLGIMAFVADPAGAALGLLQPLAFRGGWPVGQLNAPIWFESLTTGYDAAVPFYRDVIGSDLHTMSDTSDFRYSTLGEGEGALAGIMDATSFLPPGVPSHWHFYLHVADADATTAQTTAAGGTVITEPHDTPYGRLAQLADPSGAHFAVMQRSAVA